MYAYSYTDGMIIENWLDPRPSTQPRPVSIYNHLALSVSLCFAMCTAVSPLNSLLPSLNKTLIRTESCALIKWLNGLKGAAAVRWLRFWPANENFVGLTPALRLELHYMVEHTKKRIALHCTSTCHSCLFFSCLKKSRAFLVCSLSGFEWIVEQSEEHFYWWDLLDLRAIIQDDFTLSASVCLSRCLFQDWWVFGQHHISWAMTSSSVAKYRHSYTGMKGKEGWIDVLGSFFNLWRHTWA